MRRLKESEAIGREKVSIQKLQNKQRQIQTFLERHEMVKVWVKNAGSKVIASEKAEQTIKLQTHQYLQIQAANRLLKSLIKGKEWFQQKWH